MAATFEIERQIFASGLHWQILSGNPSEHKSEVKSLAKHLVFDLAIVRSTGTPQVGFAALNEGYEPGMLSAAAVVSKAVEIESGRRDFLCATELPDGRYLYVCQSEGVIVADGDVVDSAEAVRSRMLEDMSVGKNWETIFAPMEWGFTDSIERSFMEFLPRKGGKIDLKHAWWALKPIEVSIATLLKKWLPFLIVIAVAAGGAIGYKKWQAMKAAEEAARLAAMAQSEGGPAPLPPHPWKDKPLAASAVNDCMVAFDGMSTLWPGNWAPTSATCNINAGAWQIAWKRGEHGWIAHLLAIEPKAIVSPDGNSATLTTSVVKTSGLSDEDLLDERTRTMKLMSIAQEMRLAITFTQPPAPAPVVMPGGAAPPPPVVLPWKELLWLVKNSSLPPGVIVEAMDGQGFRVTNIVAQINGGKITWDMEGTQYVQQ